MKLETLVKDLVEAGWTEGGIASELRNRYGVNTAQPTIHRIKAGVSADPRWSTGYALVRLHKVVFPRSWGGCLGDDEEAGRAA